MPTPPLHVVQKQEQNLSTHHGPLPVSEGENTRKRTISAATPALNQTAPQTIIPQRAALPPLRVHRAAKRRRRPAGGYAPIPNANQTMTNTTSSSTSSMTTSTTTSSSGSSSGAQETSSFSLPTEEEINAILSDFEEKRHDEIRKLIGEKPCIINSYRERRASILHVLAAGGYLTRVEGFLKRYPNLNKPDTNGQFPIHYAAFFGKLKTVLLFLEKDKGAIDFRDFFGRLPIHHAMVSKSIPLVKALLSRAPYQIHSRMSNGDTMLTWAVELGNEELINLLLSRCSPSLMRLGPLSASFARALTLKQTRIAMILFHSLITLYPFNVNLLLFSDDRDSLFEEAKALYRNYLDKIKQRVLDDNEGFCASLLGFAYLHVKLLLLLNKQYVN